MLKFEYYVVCLRHKEKHMNKSENFDDSLQQLALFAKVISHPARLAILQYLAKTPGCISGDISDFLPLSRTTVSQHLKALRDIGLIHGEIDGLKINYCLCTSSIEKNLELFNSFFEPVRTAKFVCEPNHKAYENLDTLHG